MANVVFILGAGASREAGGPLMYDFLDTAESLWKSGEITDKKKEEHFQRVFAAIDGLQRVHSKAQLDLTNIEGIFAAFEMGSVLQSLPGTKAEDIQSVIDSLREVIVQTLQCKIQLPMSHGMVGPPSSYVQFCNLIKKLQNDPKRPRSSAVITFNYDMACDFAMYKGGLGPQYALGDDPTGVPLLKLHGSINWALCEKCEEVIPWHLAEFKKKHWWREGFPGDNHFVSLHIGA